MNYPVAGTRTRLDAKGVFCRAIRYIMVRIPFRKKDEASRLAQDAASQLSAGNFNEAEDGYKNAIALYGWSLDPYIGLAVCLIRRGDINSAEKVLARGIRFCGSHDAILNLQTRCLINSGKTEKAIESWIQWRAISVIRSYDFYAMASELFVLSVKNDIAENVRYLLLEELFYQNDDSIPDNLHPSLAYVLFHNHEHNRSLFCKMLDVVRLYISESGISANKATLSTYTIALAFNLVDNEQRQKIINENILRFAIGSHLPFVLMGSANCSIWHESLGANKITIHFVNEVISKKDLALLDAENIYKALLIADICNRNVKFKIFDFICRSDFDASTGKYEEALSYIKDKAVQGRYFVGGARKKLRIAVCISGQMRGWKRAFKSWGKIGLMSHDVTYFVNTWANEGGGSPVPPNNTRHLPSSFVSPFSDVWNELGEKEMACRYANFFALWNRASGKISTDEIFEVYGTHNAIIDDDADSPFTSMNNPHKMYYKLFKCNEMTKNHPDDFDLVIRIRPDIEFTADVNIDWISIYEECTRRKVVYAESSNSDSATYMFPNIGYAMSDFFAVSTPDNMDAYCKSYTMGAGNAPAAFPAGFEAHRNVAYSTLFNSVDVESIILPHQFIPAFSPDAKSIKDAIIKDSSGRYDKYDRKLIEALN